MKKHIVLIVALVAGLAAAFLTRLFIASKEDQLRDEERRLRDRYGSDEVLCLKRDTPAGTILSLSVLDSKEVPKVGLEDKAVKAKFSSRVIGRRLLVSSRAGEVLFWNDVEGGDTTQEGLSADIKPQMRAMSINVSGAASVSGMVRPNDHVDVMGTFDFPSDEGKLKRGDPVTCTILQNVLVLAVGHDTAKSRTGRGSLGVSSSGYATVTLEVTPREAEMLAFAEQIRGRLALTLRSPTDLYYEKELPIVDFAKIKDEIVELNNKRQMKMR